MFEGLEVLGIDLSGDEAHLRSGNVLGAASLRGRGDPGWLLDRQELGDFDLEK